MKILYLVHAVELPVQQHIIDFLRSKGYTVDVKTIGPAPISNPQTFVWSELESPSYQRVVNSINYDFIVSNTHSSFLKKFFKAVKPKCSYIDIEHDLFCASPERFPQSVVMACQNKVSNFCTKHNIPFIECQWPKLHVAYMPCELKIDPWYEAVLIGSAIFGKKINVDMCGFNRLWYKKYTSEWQTPKGLNELPKEFTGPLGIKCCVNVFKFILTVESSCFIEALIMGGLPILLPNSIVEEHKYTDILSHVSLRSKPGVGKFKAITTNNIENKLSKLKNDPHLFKSIHKEMLAEWVRDDYFDLPPAHEAIYNFIKNYRL